MVEKGGKGGQLFEFLYRKRASDEFEYRGGSLMISGGFDDVHLI